MRRGTRGWLLGLLLTMSISLAAQSTVLPMVQLTIGATSSGFSTAQIEPSGYPVATAAECKVRTAEVSWTVDGTTPTSTVGTLAAVNDVIHLRTHDTLRRFRAIRTGSSGQLDCNLYGQ